jgi:hypothetical protein
LFQRAVDLVVRLGLIATGDLAQERPTVRKKELATQL